MAPADALRDFHPTVSTWFREEIGTPTPVQEESWPRIRRGEHCLISAPTGTGKTLTAFLTAIDGLFRGEEGRVLYISPLKALNNDIERNLRRPLSAIRERFAASGEAAPEIRVGVRSGDTEQSERRRLIVHPPQILVTTPESLNLMLSSRSGLRGLGGFRLVILDEIHAVLSSKRGTYLMSALERLVPICGEFQRVGLSATVRPMKRVAEILGAFELRRRGDEATYYPRPVSTVEVGGDKRYRITIAHPGQPDSGIDSVPTSGQVDPRDEWWKMIVARLREHIARNRSTLIFANSRRMVEKLTRMINEEGGDPVYAHHGSLSREIRHVVEERLKAGELRAIVATSSLELGIDIGEIDEVILLEAPFSIASAVQRVGRAGHGVGAVSRGTFLPIHSRDLVESAVLARAIVDGAVEEINPPDKPLDVLAQIVLSAAVTEPVAVRYLLDTLRAVYAYRDLKAEELELVVEMLSGKYADTRLQELTPRIIYDRPRGVIHARKNAAMLLYMSGGVIPDRGYYSLRLSESRAKIGELDEEFVWERSLGDAFPFGNRAWRITGITNNDVFVVPADKSNSVVPFWRAEDLGRPFAFAERIGHFLREADSELAAGRSLADSLESRHFMERDAAQALEEYLVRQRAHTHAPLPHRRHVLVERYNDPTNTADAMQVVLHTIWGSRVNKPLALAISAAWNDSFGYPLEVYANNDAVLLNVPHHDQGRDSRGVDTGAFFDVLEGKDVPALLRDSIEGGGIFGARFRENAQRALLLPRKNFSDRMPLWLNRLRAKKLLQATADRDDFPIVLETWRECMQSEFDVAQLEILLEEVRRGEIVVSDVATASPSPFADSIVWRQTNARMYADDSAESALRTSLSDELLEEVLHSPHLRPDLPAELVERFRRKIQRVEPGYAPSTPEELLAWVVERRFIPSAEWGELLASMDDGGAEDVNSPVEAIRDRLVFHTVDGVEVGIVADESVPLFDAARGDPAADGDTRDNRAAGQDDGPDGALDRFLRQWIAYYPPTPLSHIFALLPFPRDRLESAIDHLVGERELLVDRFSTGARQEEICSRENLERLLRLRRAADRPDIQPLSAGEFQFFLARYQGLTARGNRIEELEHRLEQLFGVSLSAPLWESDVLPARLEPYHASWLDRAMGESDLRWMGCGRRHVTFAFETELDLIHDETAGGGDAPGDDDAHGEGVTYRETGEPDAAPIAEVYRQLSSGGRFDFLELARRVDAPSHLVAAALWELVWRGRAANDGLDALRQGIRTNFTADRVASDTPRPTVAGRLGPRGRGRRGPRSGVASGRAGYSRWKSSRPMQGTWFELPSPEDPADPLEHQELVKDRARLLFARYGVLFPALLRRELAPFSWSRVFRALRLMELSGEIRAGHFVDGVQGIQFISTAALRVLSEGDDSEPVYWMNAADPASLCGVGIPVPDLELPSRLQSTHLVFQGAKLVLISHRRGGELHFSVPPGAPRMDEYLRFFSTLLSRDERSIKRVRAERVNGVPARESPYAESLRAFGFRPEADYLTLWRRF